MTEIKQEYVTIKELAKDPSLCFSEPMLRYYLLNQHRNGLTKAIRRVGRTILFRKDLFLEWIEEQSQKIRDTFHSESISNGDALETFETIKRAGIFMSSNIDEHCKIFN